jgi:flagellar basal-body rod protein FlgG
MTPALWAAKTGLDAQDTRMSLISNNIANVNTTGYKQSRGVFQDLMYQNVRQVGSQSTQDTQLPSGMYLGTGVRVVATEKVYTQGSLTNTSNSLDVAIQGNGFFQVLMPDGTLAYSRDGTFQLNSQGQMVTSAGYQMQPPITIPANATSVTIGTDGTVGVLVPGASAPTTVGQIQLVGFANTAGLEPRGQNLLTESAASGAPQVGTPGLNGLGTLLQGNLEGSNVNVVQELVSMIETQRAYEMNSKSIETTNQMLNYLTTNL